MLNKGIDISHYDPKVDWVKAKEQGIDFVYIKATQGTTFVDPLCSTHASNAIPQGLKVGYYHFANCESDASAQAKFFCAQLARLPKYSLMPVLDLETNKANLTSFQIANWITAFLTEMAHEGHKVMLYSYQPFLDQFLTHGHGFGILPLWLAQYRNVEKPILPNGWTSCALWQYTNQGHVDGVAAQTVDMNKPFDNSFVV